MAFPIALVTRIVLNLPGLIQAGVQLVESLKVPGKTKKQKVLDSIIPGLDLAEDIVGKNLLYNTQVQVLIDAVLEAEVAVNKARAALAEGIVAVSQDPD